ncbi:secondary thiamine-phosphate synthase enzyme YjbQ [Nitriliruptor alkaliphilus]|uniref:secondary thiamine-phosphate synthase enzyme YjbQ n=1 Tax=Nitriliruptor alkaliphilus TaxID=427918 RepID=UPI000696514C|nr:secondary thiamine-phosphate synthase enzyme YjbQ [Nitriliruptor alkaliphilus]
MERRELSLRTGSRRITDVTDQCAAFVAEVGGDGLLHVFLPHATAGLALLETGAGSDEDLADHLDALLPRDDRWRHRHGSAGHGADHVLPAFISPSLTVPVDDGALALGTWQSVVVVDANADNPDRTLRLSFLPG